MFDFSTLLWYTVDKGYIWCDLVSAGQMPKVITRRPLGQRDAAESEGSPTAGASLLLYLGIGAPGVGAVKGAPIGAGVEIFSGVELAQQSKKYDPLP